MGAEFCENVYVDVDGKIDEGSKQDCEFRACERLLRWVKAEFSRR